MKQKNKSPLLELVINIVLPTLILNKGGAYLGGESGPLWALVVSVSIPAVYALYDFFQNKNVNFISILGFASILFTGVFGLMKLEGHWFAIKEAAFPFVIGFVVLVSAKTAKPLIRLLIYNDAVLNIKKVQGALIEKGSVVEFEKHLRLSTVYFSISFFISALLNYLLAVSIFTEIPIDLPEVQRSEILNQQIADMTWRGYVVIVAPSIVIMGAIMWHLFHGIKKYTGYSFNEVINDMK